MKAVGMGYPDTSEAKLFALPYCFLFNGDCSHLFFMYYCSSSDTEKLLQSYCKEVETIS